MAKGDSRSEILEKSGDRVSISANKSWFGDMGLGQVTPFWDWGLFKKTQKTQTHKALGSYIICLCYLYRYIFMSICFSVSEWKLRTPSANILRDWKYEIPFSYVLFHSGKIIFQRIFLSLL